MWNAIRWALLGAAGYFGSRWVVKYLQPRHSDVILNEAVIVITGASSGIGRAMAESFARRGSKIVLVARREEQLANVAAAIAPYAAAVLVIPTDVTDEDALRTLVDRTMERFGRIDVLINNAGVSEMGVFHTIPMTTIRSIMRVNLEAALILTQLILPMMIGQRSGKILNIASVAGRLNAPTMAAYAASKRGLLSMTESLRRELYGTGVDVIAVLPSWTRTEMLPADFDPRAYLDTPETIAERSIEAILNGENELIFGDARIRVGMWVERHFPNLMNLYWRMMLTPQYIDQVR